MKYSVADWMTNLEQKYTSFLNYGNIDYWLVYNELTLAVAHSLVNLLAVFS